MEDEQHLPADDPGDETPKRPPGDFTSEELQEDTARFLHELRQRAEQKERRLPRKKSGPPPVDP